MLDVETIVERLDALQEYIDRLRPLQALSLEELTLPENYRDYWAVERGLLLAIQCVIDISTHLVAGLRLGRVQGYGEAIRLLGKAGILPASFAEKLSRVAGFRNLLIHEYLAIDPREVYKALQNLRDLETFSKYVYRFLKQKNYLSG